MNTEFWRDRRVLVTGHTGFKGSWLSLWLQRMSSVVTGYALEPPTEPSLFERAGVAEGMTSVLGDVRDVDRLESTLRGSDPEIVIHMAAQSLVRRSYDDPLETYSTNVLGTACLFEAVRRVGGARTVVNVTSDKCYENREWMWGYRETDRLGGHDPYSNSKACAELVTQSFRDSFFPADRLGSHGVAGATARAGNVIGGGDWTTDQLIPDVIRAFEAGRPVSIRSPAAIRPWQHVLDCLAGYLSLAERLAEGGARFVGAWNFGPAAEDARPVEWIVESLCRHWGDGASWRRDDGEHPHEAGYLRLDSSRAIAELGWAPRIPLPEALEWTAEWYRRHHAGAPARELTERQIDRYGERGGAFDA